VKYRLSLGFIVLAGLFAILGSSRTAVAAPKAADLDPLVEKAIAFLKTRQNPDGSFAPKVGGPGVTGLVVAGLIRNGKADDPIVVKALAYLEGNIQKDGGIYGKGLANYTTCVALVTFKEANVGGKYDKVIANGAKFLKTLQNDGDEKDSAFGGLGYDGKGRPDLSNTHFFIDAMIAAGVPKDDPAMKNAIAFVSRCQNLPGEANDLPFATKASEDDKGGFVYNPSDAKNEKSPNRTPEGGLRSVGVMGYAGLKSFLYAGVGKDDPRVKAALTWIRAHYTVEENPGQKDTGLYYYYHTFAKALAALGEDRFADSKGIEHDWKQELFEVLRKKQGDDGSWANTNRQFQENVPELATAFALMALSYTK